MRSRRQAISGKRGEDVVMSALAYMGFLNVERIGTPVKLCVPIKGKPGHFDVVFGEKVSGDARAVLPGGKSVLIETKTDTGPENLSWSRLDAHQPDRLTAHAETGAVSLLVWNSPHGIFVMRWPIDGFGPRKSITPDVARRICVDRAEELL